MSAPWCACENQDKCRVDPLYHMGPRNCTQDNVSTNYFGFVFKLVHFGFLFTFMSYLFFNL